MIIKYRYKRFLVKALRERKPPEYVARGWAIGMFIGLVVPFGVQLYISIPLSYAMKASKVGATIGTFVTNQVTIIFLYPFQCWVGAKLLGQDCTYDFISGKFAEVLHAGSAAAAWSALMNLGGILIASFFAGGILFALLATPLTYFGVKRGVIKSRALRDAKVQARRRAFLARKGV